MFKEIVLSAQNVITILGSLVNILEGTICSLNKHGNLHSDNKQYIHTSSKNYEESGYSLNWEMATTLCELRVSNP